MTLEIPDKCNRRQILDASSDSPILYLDNDQGNKCE